jgi:pectate lyase
MKLTSLGPLLTLLSTASTAPASTHPFTDPNFSLVGFAKDNPIGETTGGANGPTVTVTTPSALVAAVKGDKPATIYLSGNFNLTSRLKVGSNKSLVGTGAGANITNAGLTIKDVENVVVRNLGT